MQDKGDQSKFNLAELTPGAAAKELKGAIKDFFEKNTDDTAGVLFLSTVITVASPELSKLLALLELVFYQGLKHSIFGTPTPWTWLKDLPSSLPVGAFFLDQGTEKFIDDVRESTRSDVGRVRVWFRGALNEKSLSQFIRVLRWNVESTLKNYEPGSVLLSQEFANFLPVLLPPFFPGLDSPTYWESVWGGQSEPHISVPEPESVHIASRRKVAALLCSDLQPSGPRETSTAVIEGGAPTGSPVSTTPPALLSMPLPLTHPTESSRTPHLLHRHTEVPSLEQEWVKLEEERRAMQQQLVVMKEQMNLELQRHRIQQEQQIAATQLERQSDEVRQLKADLAKARAGLAKEAEDLRGQQGRDREGLELLRAERDQLLSQNIQLGTQVEELSAKSAAVPHLTADRLHFLQAKETLEAENANLKEQNARLNEHIGALMKQIETLQAHLQDNATILEGERELHRGTYEKMDKEVQTKFSLQESDTVLSYYSCTGGWLYLTKLHLCFDPTFGKSAKRRLNLIDIISADKRKGLLGRATVIALVMKEGDVVEFSGLRSRKELVLKLFQQAGALRHRIQLLRNGEPDPRATVNF